MRRHSPLWAPDSQTSYTWTQFAAEPFSALQILTHSSSACSDFQNFLERILFSCSWHMEWFESIFAHSQWFWYIFSFVHFRSQSMSLWLFFHFIEPHTHFNSFFSPFNFCLGPFVKSLSSAFSSSFLCVSVVRPQMTLIKAKGGTLPSMNYIVST